jgi:hypothetical protein
MDNRLPRVLKDSEEPKHGIVMVCDHDSEWVFSCVQFYYDDRGFVNMNTGGIAPHPSVPGMGNEFIIQLYEEPVDGFEDMF